MFDFSWTELAIVAIVGILVIRPADLPEIIATLSKGIRSIKNAWSELANYTEDIINDTDLKAVQKDLELNIRHIEDAEGNLHEAYDIEQIREEFKEMKNKESV